MRSRAARLIVPAIFISVGLLNAFPAIGMFSSATVAQLYGIEPPTGDLEVLLRHRAVLFALLGAFICFAAFRRSLQTIAGIAGLTSMLSFIAIAWLAGSYGPEVQTVVVADIIASVALGGALLLRLKENSDGD